MKIKRIYIENFRGFSGPNWIDIDENLTTFVGKNDAGKSTVLEALEIFFHPKSKLVKFGVPGESLGTKISNSRNNFTVGCDLN